MAKKAPYRGTEAQEILARGIDYNGKIITTLKPEDLYVDSNYQRPLVQSTIDRIRREFDEKAMGVIQCGRRKITGENYIFDGQNRVEAVKQRQKEGLPVPERVLCLITPNTIAEDEAKLFEKCNTHKPVTGASKFRTRLFYGGEPEVQIEEIVKSHGFVLDFVASGRPTIANTSTNGIRGSNALKFAWEKTPNTFSNALYLLKMVWGNGKPNMVPFPVRVGEVVQGIAKFLFTRGNGSDKIDPLVKYLVNRHIDLGELWVHAKKTQNGYQRPEELANMLTNHTSGYAKVG